MSESAIDVNGVTRRFGRHVVLDDVSFTVRRGTITGFLGPNGAGKSTTIRIIVGLDRPNLGFAHVDGVPYRELHDPGRRVGTLIDGSGMHPRRTARNHLRIIADLLDAESGRVEAVLTDVGLVEAADRRVGTFSLGMRRRLGLASALLGEPDILILDEPSNGLDPAGIRWLRHLLQDFARRGGTVFLSSHVLGEIAQTADRIIVIDRGRIVTDTTVDALTSDAVVSARTPAAGRLAGILRDRGATVELRGADRLDISGVSQDAVGLAAFESGVPVLELLTRSLTLEERFLSLTGAAEEIGEPIGTREVEHVAG